MMTVLLLLAGCGSPAAAPPATPAKGTFRISGMVQLEPGYLQAKGVVAVLFQGGAQMLAQRRSLQTPPSLANLWPYAGFQAALDGLQTGARVVSVVKTAMDARFEFPNQVPPGKYLITVGIPVLHDPGVGEPMPREWPQQLATTVIYKLPDRELTLPAHCAWLLDVEIRDDHRSVTLGSSEMVMWPVEKPTPQQLAAVQKGFRDREDKSKNVEKLERQFLEADKFARDTGQPLHVKKAKTHESELERVRNQLGQASEELDKAVANAFPSATPHAVASQ